MSTKGHMRDSKNLTSGLPTLSVIKVVAKSAIEIPKYEFGDTPNSKTLI